MKSLIILFVVCLVISAVTSNGYRYRNRYWKGNVGGYPIGGYPNGGYPIGGYPVTGNGWPNYNVGYPMNRYRY